MTQHRFTKSAALGLALMAVAAPAASAEIRDETVVQSPKVAAAVSQVRDETVVQSPQAAAATSRIRDETVAQFAQTPPAPIHAETVVRSPESTPLAVSSPSADGIDWTDVGIGGGGVLALVLLGAGGAYAVAHRRRSQPHRMRNITV